MCHHKSPSFIKRKGRKYQLFSDLSFLNYFFVKFFIFKDKYNVTFLCLLQKLFTSSNHWYLNMILHFIIYLQVFWIVQWLNLKSFASHIWQHKGLFKGYFSFFGFYKTESWVSDCFDMVDATYTCCMHLFNPMN